MRSYRGEIRKKTKNNKKKKPQRIHLALGHLCRKKKTSCCSREKEKERVSEGREGERRDGEMGKEGEEEKKKKKKGEKGN